MGIGEEILRAYEPTEEDISKELTDEQLVKLCRRNRCRVDMWKWNVVEDFAQNFRDAGRLQGKSKRFIHKLLIKAYQRNQELFRQTEMDKDAERVEEWAYRKKNSLLQLDMWEYDEKMVEPQYDKMTPAEAETEMTASEERVELQLQYEMETLPPPIRSAIRATNNKDVAMQESKTSATDNEGEKTQETISEPDITVVEREEVVGEEEEELISVGTEQEAFAIGAVRVYQSPVKDKLRKEHISQDASIVKEMMAINSESMTIDETNLTDFTDELHEQSHEEILCLQLSELQETPLQPVVATQSSESYNDFHERMPLTSTQDAVC